MYTYFFSVVMWSLYSFSAENNFSTLQFKIIFETSFITSCVYRKALKNKTEESVRTFIEAGEAKHLDSEATLWRP